MPNWKKVITSGSNASLNQLTASAFQFIGSGTAELDVEGNITASGVISASGKLFAENITSGPAGGSEGGQLTLLSQIGGSTNWNVDNYQDRLRIFKENVGGGGGAEYISVRNTGLVGFGNDSPTAKVDISGDLRTTSHITASGDISASGDLIATGDLNLDGKSHFEGNITASANISASGTITAEHIVSSDDLVVTDSIEAKGMKLEGSTTATKLTINNTGASNIDSIINFQKSAATNWAIGGDGADNHFKIDSGDTFVGDPVFKIDASGNATITGKMTADSAEVEGGEIEIKNGGTPSNVKLYCESSNAHFTQLQATSHSNYSGNVITTLPAYAFDFNNPDFQTDVTVTGDISASGILHSSASIKTNLTKLVTYDDATGIFHITASNQFLGSGGGGSGTTTNALTAGPGLTSGGTFNGGAARTFSVDSASMGGFYSASMNNFTTTGTMTAGGDFVQSGPGTGHFISASNGNFELSGSGTALLEVQGNISASSGISASSANLGSRVTTDVVQTGRVNVDNLVLNGAALTSDDALNVDVVGDITLDADGGDVIFKDGASTKTATLNSSSLGVLGNVSSSGNFETLHSGSFGHIHTTGNISSSGIIHSSASIKSNLTKIVTYDDATGIFHITASTGFVNGAGGGSDFTFDGDQFATDLKVGRDNDNLIDFTEDNEIHFDLAGVRSITLKDTNDSGSVAVSGSVKIQPQKLIPSVSESRLYNVTSENGTYVDDLHFGTAGITPAYAFVTLDDDSTDTGNEIAFGVGSAVTVGVSYNCEVSHSNSGNGVHIKPQLTGVYKVTGNIFVDDNSSGTIIYDINVDGSTVYTATAKTHGAVDPVNRTIIYMGAISSGSTIGLTCDGVSTHLDANSALMVERLS